MALEKSSLNINFAEGLDTKTDPFQVAPSRFLSLQNAIFDKGGLLQKRNGFAQISTVGQNGTADTRVNVLAAFNDNLIAISSQFWAYNASANTWIDRTNGFNLPISLDVLPAVRSNTSQSQVDSVTAPNGLTCIVYTDNIPSGGTTTPAYKYVILDSRTGQYLFNPRSVPNATGNGLRVFLVGTNFVLVYTAVIAATDHLQFFSINYTDVSVTSGPTDISTTYTSASTVAFDGAVLNNNLYLAWNGSDLGGAVRATFIDQTLTQHTTKVFAGVSGSIFSVCASLVNNPAGQVFINFSTGNNTGSIIVLDGSLNTVSTTRTWTTSAGANILNLAAVVQQIGHEFVYVESAGTLSFDASIPYHNLERITINATGAIIPGNSNIVLRGVGLASKAFLSPFKDYSGNSNNASVMVVYASQFQPTYFLLNGLTPIAKIAYQNASGYYALGLPQATISGTTVQIPYFFKDLIQSVNKSQNATAVAGIYSQLGINVATFDFDGSSAFTSEIGQNLNISGALVRSYDGTQVVEQGFNLYPDLQLNADGTYHGLSTSGAGGLIIAQKYYYQVTFEWTDNQGNIFRSAPSIPVTITTVGATSSNTIIVPCLQLTAKTLNKVKIAIYRWSTAQQTFYQVTSIAAPLLNDQTTQSVSFVDTLADSAILGNSILYTTGGVLENIAPPPSSVMTLWQSRLWVLDAEDPNLLWFSKQVIEATPVEMSDLQTIYLAPTLGAQGSTGKTRAMSSMDDKLVLFKKDAIYYIAGQGPDITGANNQYSDPVFITGTVGCSNQHSIVLTPNGLMFQSDKGIWILGRDLSTHYIGAPVEAYTQNATVLSALTIPGTNQVRFTLSSGITLMYDYYYGQWATFSGIAGTYSVLYNDSHTFVNSKGQVFQETPGVYIDGSNPVLMSFTTAWFHLAGLQGFQRAYFFYFLGSYISPHKLQVQIAYDYNPSPTQSSIFSPTNFNPLYGAASPYGAGLYGGNANVEQGRVFLQKGKCQAFQLTITESYDSSLGVAPGAGFTMSGLNLIVGGKLRYPKLPSSSSIG